MLDISDCFDGIFLNQLSFSLAGSVVALLNALYFDRWIIGTFWTRVPIEGPLAAALEPFWSYIR